MVNNTISLFTDILVSKFVWIIPIISIFYLFEKSRFGGIYLNKLEKRKLLYLTDRYKKTIIRFAYSNIKFFIISEIYKVIIKNNIKDPNRQKVIRLSLFNKLKNVIIQTIDELIIFEESNNTKITDHLLTYDDDKIAVMLEPIFEFLFNTDDDLKITQDTILIVVENTFSNMYTDYVMHLTTNK